MSWFPPANLGIANSVLRGGPRVGISPDSPCPPEHRELPGKGGRGKQVFKQICWTAQPSGKAGVLGA